MTPALPRAYRGRRVCPAGLILRARTRSPLAKRGDDAFFSFTGDGPRAAWASLDQARNVLGITGTTTRQIRKGDSHDSLDPGSAGRIEFRGKARDREHFEPVWFRPGLPTIRGASRRHRNTSALPLLTLGGHCLNPIARSYEVLLESGEDHLGPSRAGLFALMLAALSVSLSQQVFANPAQDCEEIRRVRAKQVCDVPTGRPNLRMRLCT